MLDDAASYIAQDSRPVAERLLIQAIEAASSLDVFSERGRVVPELDQPSVRQLLVQRYRLIYEVKPDEGIRRLTGFTLTTERSWR